MGNHVFAHTSKTGYHVYEQKHTQTFSPFRGGSESSSIRSGTAGLSYKSEPKSSDGRKPTDYSRIVMRAVGRSYNYHDINGYLRGDCSFWSNGLKMNTRPWGQLSLYAGNVHPSSHLEANAILRSKGKLNGNAANLLEDLAQASQTARMAKDIVEDIGKATAKYLSVYASLLASAGMPLAVGGPKFHRRRRSGDDVVRKIARAWLTWFYGVKPLISTLNELGKAWEPKYKTIRASSSMREVLNPADLFGNAQYGRNRATITGKAYEEVTCVLIVDAKLTSNLAALANLGFHGGDPFVPEAHENYGSLLHSVDILTTAWALIPYSFVFDWIIPVEKFLQSLYWSPHLLYKGGYVTKYMYGKADAVIENNTSFGYGYGGKMPSGSVEALFFEREAYGNYPPPSILAVNQSLSQTAQASAAALIALKR